MSEPRLVVERVRRPEDLEACLRIRRRVFVEEQAVPLDLEVDGLDPICRHYLARREGVAVGTARIKEIEGGGAKLQRIAVLAEARGFGVGRALVLAMIGALEAEALGRPIVLDSQASAIAFYERLGFVAEGPEFFDAGIPHRHMRRASPI